MNIIGEKALIDSVIQEIKNAGALKARVDQLDTSMFGALKERDDAVARAKALQVRYEDLNAKWRCLSASKGVSDPKITALYNSAQTLILELRRRKISSTDVAKAKMSLIDACREVFEHVDLIPF